MGLDAMIALNRDADLVAKGDDIKSILRMWTSVFNAVSVIANRETPYHRDYQSRPDWYNLLVTVGKYKEARLSFPGLAMELQYNPGTAVGFAGKIIWHEVARFQGERLCLAYYMRDKIHERLC